MFIPAPFAISSHPVTRRKSYSEVIVEGSSFDINHESAAVEDFGSKAATLDLPRATQAGSNINALCNTVCHAESGWVSRKKGDVQLFSQPSSTPSSTAKIQQSLSEFQDCPSTQGCHTVSLTQDLGGFSHARRSLLSIRNLPHPSELQRRKGTRKRLHAEIECSVDKHVQQLGKKKHLYYTTPLQIRPSPSSTEIWLPAMSEEPGIDKVVFTDQLHSPNSLSPMKLRERQLSPEVALVPVTNLAIDDISIPRPSSKPAEDEEEDGNWFRSHWQSRPSTQTSVTAALDHASPASSQVLPMSTGIYHQRGFKTTFQKSIFAIHVTQIKNRKSKVRHQSLKCSLIGNRVSTAKGETRQIRSLEE